MAAATVQLQVFTGSGAGGAMNGEGGFKYNREDSVSGTTPIPIPTGAGTNYSWLKFLGLSVVSSGTTSMSNRRIQLSNVETTGLGVFFQATAGYTQPSSGTMPASAAGSGLPAPSGYTRATTSLLAYDTSSAATSSTGRNGQYCMTTLGVDSTYTGGAGTAIALRDGGNMDIRLVYDEA